jgi:predicted secreted hydrolase
MKNLLRRRTARDYFLLACLGSVAAVALTACGVSNSVEITPTATATPTPSPTPVPTPTPTSSAVPTHSVILPQDEGPHDTPIEWWYFNGHLRDDAGNQYSFHYVTFEIITPDGATPQLLQLSWADHTKGVYLTDEKLFVANGSEGALQDEGSFNFRVSGWEMRGDGRNYRLAFDTKEHSLELQANSIKPPTLHLGSGLIDMGAAGKAYYYSRTRLETSGTLAVNGETRRVTGTAWMDHQWGDAGTAVEVGWDWVSLQLEDGSELMVSLIWDTINRQPIVGYGTYVPPLQDSEGTTTEVLHIPGEEIRLMATGSWTSPAHGAVYPMGWELEINSLPLSLTLTPVQQDAEFADSRYSPVSYWEGAVSVEGDKNGEGVNGKGFVELVGYAPRPQDSSPTPAR